MRDRSCYVCRARPRSGHLLCAPCARSYDRAREQSVTTEALIRWTADRVRRAAPAPVVAPATDARTWYVEARVGSQNFRGECVRFIDDRRGTNGGYVNRPVEEVLAELLAPAAPLPVETDATPAGYAHCRSACYVDGVPCTCPAPAPLDDGGATPTATHEYRTTPSGETRCTRCSVLLGEALSVVCPRALDDGETGGAP